VLEQERGYLDVMLREAERRLARSSRLIAAGRPEDAAVHTARAVYHMLRAEESYAYLRKKRAI